jgi:hypothetical protein
LLFPLDNSTLISSCHSPRNIGSTNNSLVFRWTTREDIDQGKDWELALDFTYPDIKVKAFESNQSWKDLFEKMVEYLNNYVRPHELYSISCFEDNHEALDPSSSEEEDEDEESDETKEKEVRRKPNKFRGTVTFDGDGSRPLNIEPVRDDPNFPPYSFKIFDKPNGDKKQLF